MNYCIIIFAFASNFVPIIAQSLEGESTQLSGCLPCCMKGDAGPPGQPAPVTKVAFSAGRTTHMYSNPTQQIVVFDHVITNLGNGYDENTGIFTCPVSGTYFFTFNGLKNYGKNLHLKLMKNRVEIVSAHSGQGLGSLGPSELQHTGNDVIIHCDEGDGVWIWLSYSDSNPYQLFSHPTHKYTSFSGYIIFVD
ncbi:complement C1q-like protein 4 [Saccoglossus kowalevskii]|uniref:Complement C1q-like protein 4-like n=1 Tax=Saccoglossus kowalevskii TaxID=10224 RepID=A0ABM0MT18_SACKO|nr:PREDICTED: complement C1q-like protein 4-like [Saccoglossus kowalevskii]